MQTIDFLPAKYRELDAQRRRSAWRVGVLLLFGAVVAASALFQQRMRGAVQDQLAAVTAELAVAQAKHQQLGQLQSELAAARDAAALVAYLQHPWPRTRILAELSRTMPTTMTLAEVRIEQEKTTKALLGSSGRPSFVPESAEQAAQQAQLSAAMRDLQRLREELDTTHTVIHLTGATYDPAQLHQYVGALARSPLFAKAELGSLESVATTEQAGSAAAETRFSIRLIVRAGYGQPGGPAGPLRTTVSASLGPGEQQR